jgi:hypothetical protein
MGSNFQLVMRKGGNPGQVFPLDLTEMYIGRDVNCEIAINDTEVSRRHARISISGQGFVIEDLGSTNGTFINGQRISSPQVMIPGAIIALGDSVTLQFEVSEVDPDATRAGMPPSPVGQTFVSVPPQPSYSSPPMQPVPPQMPAHNVPVAPQAPAQQYSGQVPPSPKAGPVKPAKKSKVWLIILIILLGIICLCVVGAIVIDSMNLYCDLVPGIMNAFFGAGACP